MKSKFAWFWFFVSLGLAGLLIAQMREARKRKQMVEDLQLQMENMDGRSDGRVRELEQERQKLRGELKATENELNSARLAYSSLAQMTNLSGAPTRGAGQAASAGGAATPMAGMQNMLGKMFND